MLILLIVTGSTGVPGFGDGSLYTTEDEKDLLSHVITTLNKTYGLNLTEEDKRTCSTSAPN